MFIWPPVDISKSAGKMKNSEDPDQWSDAALCTYTVYSAILVLLLNLS